MFKHLAAKMRHIGVSTAIWRCSKSWDQTKSNLYHPSVEITDFHLPKFTLRTFWYLNHRGEIWSHDSWPWGTAVSWKFSTSFQQCQIAKFWCQWSVWSLNSFRFKRMDLFCPLRESFLLIGTWSCGFLLLRSTFCCPFQLLPTRSFHLFSSWCSSLQETSENASNITRGTCNCIGWKKW